MIVYIFKDRISSSSMTFIDRYLSNAVCALVNRGGRWAEGFGHREALVGP